MRIAHALQLATLGVAALASASCGDVELHSRYRDTGVVVDGRFDDWKGNMSFVDEANLLVGISNDDSDLYVILVVGDREAQHRIMTSGMFLWFDPGGGDDRQFGIHYPLGLQNAAESTAPRETGSEREKLRDRFARESLDEAELIGAGGAVRITRSVSNLPEVRVSARQERGAMVYEYRIPLASNVDNPFGVGAVPGQSVGVGLVTPEVDPSAMRENMRGKMSGGGRDGMRGGRAGMGGGRPGGARGGRSGPPGGRVEMPDPIDVWATVELATKTVD